MTIWVEQLGPRQKVLTRTRFESPTVQVGRAYSGDIIIDDPEAEASHLTVRHETDGTLVARAGEGLHFGIVGDKRKRIEQETLTPDTVIRIGKSLLRFRTATAIAVPRGTAQHGIASGKGLLAGLRAATPLLLAIALMAGVQWLQADSGQPFAHILIGAVPVLLLALPWIASWALTSLVISHHGNTLSHTRITGYGLLSIIAISSGIPLLAFALGWTPGEHTQTHLLILSLSLAFGAHILAIGEGRRMWRGAVLGTLVALLVGGAILFDLTTKSDRLAIPNTVSLAPAFLRMVPVETLDSALSAFGQLEEAAAASRFEPLPDHGH